MPSRLKLADDGHSASSQRTKSCIKNPCRTQQHGWTFFVKSIASSSPPPSAHSPWRIQTLCTTTSPTWFHGNSFVSKSPGHQFNGDFQEISSSLTEEQCWSIRMAKLPLKPKHWMACISQSNGSPKVWPMASSGMGLAIPSSPHHQRSNLPNMIYHNLNQAKSNLHNPAPSSIIEMVTFPGIPNDVPSEVKAAVKRLHMNLGHPSERELLRLLAYQGAISKHMITAVKHLHCSSCIRAKPAKQPRPSTIPKANLGQFNDSLQTDVFYCRDVAGTNYAVLGIIDQSTLLHKAARLPDMSSETTLQLFRQLWFQPFGFPVTIRCDPGTNYGLHFKQYAERHGIWLEFIPAEAHWRVGLIERRNSVLRDIMERIIDAEAIFNADDFDQAIEAATHALNSMTYSHGRPPYMAVFGQIPRIGSGLLQDDTALICHPDQIGTVRPDVLRAEAIKALADINTSQALRRALLRKTAASHQRDLLPGQNCAYWRWQVPKGKSTKKKGAWIVARFLSYDPDNKSAWVHSGTTTVHVALEQLRGAVGFEHWQPSREDQQMLKEAAHNIRQGLWEDHQATAPPIDEDSYDYQLDALEDNTAAAAEAQAEQATASEPGPMPLALPLTPPQRLEQQASRQAAQDTPRSKSTPPTFHQRVQQVTEQHIQQEATTNLHLSGIHIHSYPASPTAESAQAEPTTTPLDYHPQRYGLTRTARSRTPTNRRIRLTSGTPHTPRTPARGAWTTPVPETPPLPVRQPAPIAPPATAPAGNAIQAEQQQQDSTEQQAEQASQAQDSARQSGSTTTQFSSSHTGTAEAPAATDTNAAAASTGQTALPTLPQKRTYEAMLASMLDSIDPPHHTWDGSPPTYIVNQQHCTTFAQAALPLLHAEGYAVLSTDLTGAQEESDAESSGPDDSTDPASRLISRKEAKALEREIPWREIMKMPEDDIKAYVASAQKEEKGWSHPR